MAEHDQMMHARKPRVMLYVQHLLGIGHLMRARRIASALDKDGFQVTLVTGGLPVSGFESPSIDQVALASMAVRDGSFGELVDASGKLIDDAFKARRSQHLLDIFEQCRPDLVMLEAFPFGRRQMRFELLPLINAIQNCAPKPKLVTSIRDVLQRNRKPGRDEETANLVTQYFDKVLVHGDPNFTTLDETFPFTSAIADKIVYTGLVCAPLPEASAQRFDIVVSAGGGAVGKPLVEACLLAAAQLPEISSWCVITGPNLPQDEYDALAHRVPTNVELARFRTDFLGLLANARLSISQAGYNTVNDILQAQCRALLIPFSEHGETEQADRASRMKKLGLASVLSEDALSDKLTSGNKLSAAIRTALPRESAPIAPTINVDGAVGTAKVLRQLLGI
ncbi:MAG: hypothetical protein KTR32_33620 [Granulosicoccus sp.]|nr:hypothetical protein [Granulosicoccus sp.]